MHFEITRLGLVGFLANISSSWSFLVETEVWSRSLLKHWAVFSRVLSESLAREVC